jgi:hypothetical protein
VRVFHSFSALSQLLHHVVEGTTEVPDFVIAMGKAYRDIEVPFSEADNLVPKFRHDNLQIITTVSYG